MENKNNTPEKKIRRTLISSVQKQCQRSDSFIIYESNDLTTTLIFSYTRPL